MLFFHCRANLAAIRGGSRLLRLLADPGNFSELAADIAGCMSFSNSVVQLGKRIVQLIERLSMNPCGPEAAFGKFKSFRTYPENLRQGRFLWQR
jgi:hypothetical protein